MANAQPPWAYHSHAPQQQHHTAENYLQYWSNQNQQDEVQFNISINNEYDF